MFTTLLRWPLRAGARPVLLALGLGIGVAAPAWAQQAPATIRLLPEDAERGLNGHQHNFYFLPPGVEGEKYVNAGFWGQKLRPYVAHSPTALASLNDYRRQKNLYLLDRVVVLGAVGVYGHQVFAAGFPTYFNGIQQVAVGTFAVGMLASLFITRHTNEHLQRAVAEANATPAQGSLWPRLRPTDIGLGRAATGQPLLTLRWALR